MTRLLSGAAVWLLGCAVLFAVAAWCAANGVASLGAAQLSGWTIVADEAKATYATFLAADPPLPFLIGYLAAPFAAWGGIQPAGLAAVLIGALLCLGWYGGLRRAAYGPAAAAACVLLLAVNPLFLRAFVAGPAEMLLMLGVWLLAVGLAGLRARTEATDVMTVGFALALIAFGHPDGLILAVAALPFLALATPPDLLDKGAGQIFLLLLFPTLFALLGLIYIYWLFGSDGAAFLRRFSDNFGGGAAADPLRAVWRMLALGLAAAPMAFIAALRARRRMPVLATLIALTAMLTAAAGLRALLGGGADNGLTAAPALSLAAFGAAAWPATRHRLLPVIAALAVGIVGGAATIAPAAGSRTLPALLSSAGDLPAAQRLARFLDGRDGIMLDGNAHPEAVALRGTARGLLLPGEDAFELQLLAKRLTADYVVARDPRRAPDSPDRLALALPKLYLRGAPGYQLLYDQDGWRVYRRRDLQPPVSSERQR